MKVHGYNSAELQLFYGVLDRLVTEDAERDLQLPVSAMIQRLFEAADQGERDPERLRLAILCDDADAGGSRRGCFMDDLKRELSALEHSLAQLERGDLYKQRIGPKNVDVLAVVKAGYRRRIAGLKQRLA